MLAFILVVSGVLVSMFINTQIKAWIYSNIVEPELEQLGENEEPSNSLVYTTIAMVLINNLIPLTLGVAIGLHAIL